MCSLSVFAGACVLLVYGTLAYPTYPDLPDLVEYLAYGEAPVGPQVNPQWPSPSIHLGQVAGVEAGPGDKVIVFHRGSRRWDFSTFLANHSFAHPEDGAIKEKTIVTINSKTGQQMAAMGANKYYMPHGLTLDHHGNLWVTDVALHQVMRIPKGDEEPDLVLGEKLTPGSDDTHFCKPTDVAVASNGDFFVSDGYCNSRIMKFNENGTLIKKWGEKAEGKLTSMSLRVPHSLALVEKEDMLCVADREDARVQCYNAGLKDSDKTGDFMRTLFPVNAIGNVYAIAYDATADVIYAVVNPESNEDRARGYTISLDGRGLEEWWIEHEHRSLPHDVSVSPDGNDIYVGDIGTGTAVKLERFEPVKKE